MSEVEEFTSYIRNMRDLNLKRKKIQMLVFYYFLQKKLINI